MKFKILSITLFLSLYIPESYGSKSECSHVDEHGPLQTTTTIITPAEIFSLPDLGNKASNISCTRESIEKYTHFVQQNINHLKALMPPCAILEHPFERLSSFPIKEVTGFIKGFRGFREFVGVELESYFALSKILRQYYESASSLFEFRHYSGALHISYFGLPWVNLLLRSSKRICSNYTVDKFGEITDKFLALQNLKRMESYRQNLLTRWQRVISDKIPKALSIFFQNSAPILYKAVEDVSKHSKGRLAGVALYSDERTISIIAGRKALTKGDDKDHHIERELIKKSLPPHAHNGGYLFVYTTLPPCNTDTTGCLSFYRQLAQRNPNLRIMVMFDHEYEDDLDYTGLTSNLTMINRVKEAKKLELAEARKRSITNMALTLTRATSDQIVVTLQKKDDETAIRIVEQFSDHERKERIKKRLAKTTK
ncbi:MAG: hypothetical protein NT128_01045 [Proteobacteria bacterium]|nr:hypothetical protein [Pseudomonadota bacterium]